MRQHEATARYLYVTDSTSFLSKRNTVSEQMPLNRTTYVLILNLDPDDLAQVADNSTFGGIESSSQPRPFWQNYKLPQRDLQQYTTTMPVHHTYGNQSINACLPRCSSSDPNKCLDISACNYNPGSVESTINEYVDRAAFAFVRQLQTGFYRPMGPNIKLACPY